MNKMSLTNSISNVRNPGFGASRFNRLIARNHFFCFSRSFSEGIRKNFLSGPQRAVQSTTQQEWTILFSKSSSKRAKQSNYRYLAVFPATRFPWCNATNINNDVTKDPPIDTPIRHFIFTFLIFSSLLFEINSSLSWCVMEKGRRKSL